MKLPESTATVRSAGSRSSSATDSARGRCAAGRCRRGAFVRERQSRQRTWRAIRSRRAADRYPVARNVPAASAGPPSFLSRRTLVPPARYPSAPGQDAGTARAVSATSPSTPRCTGRWAPMALASRPGSTGCRRTALWPPRRSPAARRTSPRAGSAARPSAGAPPAMNTGLLAPRSTPASAVAVRRTVRADRRAGPAVPGLARTSRLDIKRQRQDHRPPAKRGV